MIGPERQLAAATRVLDTVRLHEPNGGKWTLGLDHARGPVCFPPRPFYVELPSGLRHHFESEVDARESAYWPR